MHPRPPTTRISSSHHDVEMRPQLSLANSILLPGRTLTVVHVNNNLRQGQSGHLYEIEPNYPSNK